MKSDSMSEELVAAIQQIRDQNLDAEPNLTLEQMRVNMEERQQLLPLPVGGMLLSPWTDLAATGESTRSRAELDPMIAPDELTAIAQNYHIGNEATDPLVSPLYADLTGLPELLVQVGGAEILYDDSTRLAANALKQGVSVDLQEWEHAFHVYQAFPGLPESAAALDEMGKFFERVTS